MSTQGQTLTLTPSEMASAILAWFPTKRPIFNWGPPGIAKSAVAIQTANALGIAFADIRLSQMDPSDLRGIPYPVIENDIRGIHWSAPFVLPRDLNLSVVKTAEHAETVTLSFPASNPCGSNGIHYITNPEFTVKSLTKGAEARIIESGFDFVEVGLFDASGEIVPGTVRIKATGKARALVGLEELNSAPQSVQAACYQLVLDYRLGDYIVPDGCYLMAMGNRETDKGVAFKMPLALVNRFVNLEQRVDFDEWQIWALGAGIHPEVVGFLSAFKHKLFDFNPASASRGFATPRSWHMVSDFLNSRPTVTEQVFMTSIVGCVGEGIGAEFHQFRKIAADLPKADEILSGRLKKFHKPVEIQLQFALSTALGYELKERAAKVQRENGADWKKSKARQQWLAEADNFLEFQMENFGPEINIMSARTAIKVLRLPFSTNGMRCFDVFSNAFKDYIVQ